MINEKVSVIVSFQLEGMHCWPQAREVFPDVGFLSDPHRHMFHFKLAVKVNHDDRDVEFIRFKREVIRFLNSMYRKQEGYLDFESMSCEMIARQLFVEYNCDWVEVWEDGENGSRIEKSQA